MHPGHTDPTTIGDEWETTRSCGCGAGSTRRATSPARSGARTRTLVLWAPDYDGGHKAWVRWADGSDDIVPGSAVSAGAGDRLRAREA